jgi:ATP-binding cassette subfamily B protein
MRVMVIDDSADARESLGMVLEVEGADVLLFDSGRAVLDWLGRHPASLWPAAMVCDIVLGDEDGYAVMRSVRHLEDQRRVPLEQRMPAIALTGLAQPDDRVRALMAGFQVHLVKPVEPRELVVALYTLAGRGGPVQAAA